MSDWHFMVLSFPYNIVIVPFVFVTFYYIVLRDARLPCGPY